LSRERNGAKRVFDAAYVENDVAPSPILWLFCKIIILFRLVHQQKETMRHFAAPAPQLWL
jgi:hypothetical protein